MNGYMSEKNNIIYHSWSLDYNNLVIWFNGNPGRKEGLTY